MIKARYTVVLKTIIDDPELSKQLTLAMSSYPMYTAKSEEKYIPSVIPTREELNRKILNYYKYREIGFETIGRFLDELEIALNEIMPYYNQLMFTIDQDYNILYNVDYDKEITSKRDVGSTSSDLSTNTSEAHDTGTTESSGTDKGKSVHSDTPQGRLGITKDQIDSVDYADSVQWTDNGTTTNSTVTGDTTGKTIIDQNGRSDMSDTSEMHERIFGNYGQMSYQYLVEKYRELIMNIEQRIINDRRIQELFMLVY